MSFLISLLLNFLTITKNVSESYCDIKGNVKNPGVYLVEEGDVINDIILKAGGLKKNSYVKNINLSKKVTDEMVISIMTIDEYEELIKECPVCECEIPTCEEEIKETTTTNNNTTIKMFESTSITTNMTTKTTTLTTSKITTDIITSNVSEMININTASVEELITLPGIGEVTAKKIIEYREVNFFEKIEDILKVKGIGNALFNKIKDYIKV